MRIHPSAFCLALILGASFCVSVAVMRAQATPESAQEATASKTSTVPASKYPPELVEKGAALFREDCSFCHGRDAGGGESGPDLTRSKVVTADVNGNRIGPVIRNGRPDKGMPPFDRSDDQIASLAAFIHSQQEKAVAASGRGAGGRRGFSIRWNAAR